jgi:hypothetical protein
MKSLGLALGLFFLFLLMRNTLTMVAQEVVPAAHDWSQADQHTLSPSESRLRRLASLEAQDRELAVRETELNSQFDHTAEARRQVQSLLEVEPGDTDAQPARPELTAQRSQLIEKQRELRQDLDRVVSERHRLHDEWAAATAGRSVLIAAR